MNQRPHHVALALAGGSGAARRRRTAHRLLLRTEVGWENTALLGFFRREGFVMAQRVCLDMNLAATR